MAFLEVEAPASEPVLACREEKGFWGQTYWGPASRVAVGPCLRHSTSLCLFLHLDNEAVKSTSFVGL